jgi:outer membrane biogenesis lipoprotein LolB
MAYTAEMKSLLALAAIALLAGCSTYAQRVQATCTSLGAPPGSSAYWPCVQQQQAIDAQDRAMWGGVLAASVTPAPIIIVPRY